MKGGDIVVYLISYDLHKMKNYPKLHEKIQSLGNCIRPLESLWLVDSSLSIGQINDIVSGVIDNDDNYYITTINNSGAGILSKELWQWINGKFLGPADLRKGLSLGRNPLIRKNPFPPKL